MTAIEKLDALNVRGFLGVANSIKTPKYQLLIKTLNSVGVIDIPDTPYRHSQLFLARSIVGQQLSVKAAKTIWLRLEAKANAHGGEVTDILSHDYTEDIRSCGISGNKTKALICMKDYYATNNLQDGYLQSLQHQKRSQQLLEIWGIGQWTCDMLSIFFFKEKDIWPKDDAAVQRSLKQLLKKDRLSEKDFISVGNKFKPYRSLLCIYLWHILDTEEVI